MGTKANRALAARLRRDARAYAKPFRRDRDAEFRATIARDVADLERVASYLEVGNLRAAARRFRALDTVVREAASEEVWELLDA